MRDRSSPDRRWPRPGAAGPRSRLFPSPARERRARLRQQQDLVRRQERLRRRVFDAGLPGADRAFVGGALSRLRLILSRLPDDVLVSGACLAWRERLTVQLEKLVGLAVRSAAAGRLPSTVEEERQVRHAARLARSSEAAGDEARADVLDVLAQLEADLMDPRPTA